MTYSYIYRTYGLAFEVGQRVQHDETGEIGVVVKEARSHTHYVRVRFDGRKCPGLCHPQALRVLREEPAS
jgi:hypothetical protein